jgi:cathepsin L
MKSIIILCAVIALSSALSLREILQNEWESFKLEHSKQYSSETEEQFRLKIFLENKNKIAKHNQLYATGRIPYKLGVNKYADMLHHEFISTLNGYNRTSGSNSNSLQGTFHSSKNQGITFISPANVEIPKTIDWRTKGAVTEIKDQGHCGSCWSFSATGALEGQHFRKSGVLVSLSEQNLIDCSGSYGNNGCDGGLMDNAFSYIKDNGGIDTEITYPYEGKDDSCRYSPKNNGATDKGFVDIPEGKEDKLQEALATIGPCSVAIDASHESFQFYQTGVYYEPQCDSQQLDHGVLVVGYGTEGSGQDYWLVKNSWGTTWGDKGYVKMARNKDNHCGIATTASYPLV